MGQHQKTYAKDAAMHRDLYKQAEIMIPPAFIVSQWMQGNLLSPPQTHHICISKSIAFNFSAKNE